ncbi:MAG: ATP-binding protein, partial [Isosphaeraceae bacterium]
MDDYRPVSRLKDVGAAVRVQPLESGDRRYVDLGQGRQTDDLKLLRVCLQDHDASQNSFAKAALTGHRGCGKSTELLR